MANKYLKVPVQLAQNIAQYIQETPCPNAPMKIPMTLCMDLRGCSQIIELDDEEKAAAKEADKEEAGEEDIVDAGVVEKEDS